MQALDLAAVRVAALHREPYPHFCGSSFLKADAIDDLRRDFPAISKSGYLTVDDVRLQGRFRTLIDELEGPELSEELSQKFGRDLNKYPRLTTIMSQSSTKHGAIHTDGASTIMTLLVYMNDEWNAGPEGRLRVLYDGRNFEPHAAPVMGTVGSDNSWHGHRPLTGERRVVRVAWVADQAELDRKKKRNAFAQLLKGVFGR